MSVIAARQPGERTSDRRALLLGIGFCATGAIAALVTPRRHEDTIGAAKLADIIPRQVSSWLSQPSNNLVLPETQAPGSIYDQILTRSYLSPELPNVMLLIAYGAAQSGLMKVHRPEVCYVSSGFAVGPLIRADVRYGSTEIAAQTFSAQRQDRVEQVLYWTRVSNGFPRNLTSERLLLLERGVQGVIPDGVLVRASVLDEGPAAVAALQRFMTDLVQTSTGEGRSLLVGHP